MQRDMTDEGQQADERHRGPTKDKGQHQNRRPLTYIGRPN